MKWLFKTVTLHSNSKGFTLIELLIAMSLTSIMLALAGYGVATILHANRQSESEISRRANLNRALDFMADEIRMAKAIAVPATNAISPPSCGTATGVLDLTMPNDTHVIYYVHDVSNCSQLWTQPGTIRRIQGSTDSLLVDALMAPTTLPAGCSTAPLSLRGASGFYACLNQNNNHVATLYLYGKLTDTTGRVTGVYPVSSEVSARSY
ncbi:prepilin-type N-terminal cleavage/methylation domain-containing protein [Leptolyngbya sp. FACHB-16]|nr:prepilin-type N-terminal cleavage/methylation domain-containing protein [Leptolyngbya sp. FACHB-16]MBD2158137.1 prepilin-type N-terminal cleavage/methylation domain-containing protein [Leptolyngbya sp. FACHB-16]